ncbi:MAG TPA: alpha/beta hydrolase family protein [Thermoleophilaceae bacterium]|jgi:S-formylglutathione hydrolase FrmB
MRRLLAVPLAAVAALALAAPASASRLVTLTTSSRYVDPAAVPFNGPPPDTPERPNALRANVLLPDGYSKRHRYPVLYLLHGHGDAYDHWANPKRGNVAEIAKGFPGIVVMPEGARGWYVNWWSDGTRKPGWESYHLDELTRLVERRFRVRPGRRWHAIAGLSMGGLGAMFYATQRPGYFGSAASFSGPLSIQRDPDGPLVYDSQGEPHEQVLGDPVAQRFYWTGHNPTALVESLRYTRLYVTVGDGTPAADPDQVRNTFGQVAEAALRQHAEDFVAAARALSLDVTYRPRQGIHDWPYWREHLADALRWGFFAPVAESPRSWRFSTVARWSEAWGFRVFMPKAPGELVTIERDGDVLRGTGSGLARIRTPGGRRIVRQLPFAVPIPR